MIRIPYGCREYLFTKKPDHMNFLKSFGLMILFSLNIQCQKEPSLQINNHANIQTENANVNAADVGEACWGQATAVFAQMRAMGNHASQQSNPRLGLRNLARELFEFGIIADDSMEALGQFVSSELGLSIDACQ